MYWRFYSCFLEHLRYVVCVVPGIMNSKNGPRHNCCVPTIEVFILFLPTTVNYDHAVVSTVIKTSESSFNILD